MPIAEGKVKRPLGIVYVIPVLYMYVCTPRETRCTLRQAVFRRTRHRLYTFASYWVPAP